MTEDNNNTEADCDPALMKEHLLKLIELGDCVMEERILKIIPYLDTYHDQSPEQQGEIRWVVYSLATINLEEILFQERVAELCAGLGENDPSDGDEWKQGGYPPPSNDL